VTWSLTEAITVPLAAVVDPAAAASLLFATSVLGSAAAAFRSASPIAGALTLAVGSAGLSALDLVVAGSIGHAVLEHDNGSTGRIVAVALGAGCMQLLGMLGGAALYSLSGRARDLALELEVLHLAPLVAVLGALLLLAYDPRNLLALVPAVVLCVAFCETVRRFGYRALELRRRDEDRSALLRMVLESSDEQRKSLALRVHDGPLQSILALKLAVEAAEPDDIAARGVPEALDAVARELRDLMRVSLPGPDLPSLDRAVLQERSAFERGFHHGVHVDFDVTDELEPGMELLLFRVLHESLLNAQRHSGAQEVRVTLRQEAESVLLRVEDDGKGVRPERLDEALRSGHLGVATMRERVEQVNGRFDLRSSNRGTCVEVTIPLVRKRVSRRNWRRTEEGVTQADVD
jgi:signal transduction histidine kinase